MMFAMLIMLVELLCNLLHRNLTLNLLSSKLNQKFRHAKSIHRPANQSRFSTPRLSLYHQAHPFLCMYQSQSYCNVNYSALFPNSSHLPVIIKSNGYFSHYHWNLRTSEEEEHKKFCLRLYLS